LNVRALYRELMVRLSFDGAVASYENALDGVGRLTTGLKDAYLGYSFGEWGQVYAGRFKPPYDVESLTPTRDLLFVNTALESRGVLPHEGFSADMTGMAPGRQLGLMLRSDRAFGAGALDVGYALAL